MADLVVLLLLVIVIVGGAMVLYRNPIDFQD